MRTLVAFPWLSFTPGECSVFIDVSFGDKRCMTDCVCSMSLLIASGEESAAVQLANQALQPRNESEEKVRHHCKS